jgi:hypothetical protein
MQEIEAIFVGNEKDLIFESVVQSSYDFDVELCIVKTSPKLIFFVACKLDHFGKQRKHCLKSHVVLREN